MKISTVIRWSRKSDVSFLMYHGWGRKFWKILYYSTVQVQMQSKGEPRTASELRRHIQTSTGLSMGRYHHSEVWNIYTPGGSQPSKHGVRNRLLQQYCKVIIVGRNIVLYFWLYLSEAKKSQFLKIIEVHWRSDSPKFFFSVYDLKNIDLARSFLMRDAENI